MKIGHHWVVMALIENFMVRAPKYRFDYNHHKASRKR